MSFRIHNLSWLGLLLLTASCGTSEPMGNEPVSPEYRKGMVIDMHKLDGCSWLIELESGQRLQPVNLPGDFRKDGKVVNIIYVPEQNMMSACMAGTMVRIRDIRELPKQ